MEVLLSKIERALADRYLVRWLALLFALAGRIIKIFSESFIMVRIIFETAKLIVRNINVSTCSILSVPYGGAHGSAMFVGGYLAHLISKVPLFVYELDEWRASILPAKHDVSLWVERCLHRRILAGARRVWVISEPLQIEFRNRFKVEAHVLPSCVAPERVQSQLVKQTAGSTPWIILYTGSVYYAQASAIRSVLVALQSDPEKKWLLVILTHQGSDALAEMGISGSCVEIKPPVEYSLLPSVISHADILLLPFSFEKTAKAVVSTSLPTKVADYLASGVPVLVHAPCYSTVAKLASKEGWGEVISTPDPQTLCSVLYRMAVDESLRRRLVGNALRCVNASHNLSVRKSEFVAALQCQIS
jgi:glycosyltransferase involved in cell wall biosynthesis